jgi:hypothetical protein
MEGWAQTCTSCTSFTSTDTASERGYARCSGHGTYCNWNHRFTWKVALGLELEDLAGTADVRVRQTWTRPGLAIDPDLPCYSVSVVDNSGTRREYTDTVSWHPGMCGSVLIIRNWIAKQLGKTTLFSGTVHGVTGTGVGASHGIASAKSRKTV